MREIKFIKKLIQQEKIKIIAPNKEVSNSYYIKSNNSLKAAKILNMQELYEESISMSYYSMFHIVLSLFFKVGIKCENHSATIIILKELFNIDNSKISYAKEERVDKQYYIDFQITKEDSYELVEMAEEFNSQIFNFIENLNQNQIEKYNEDFKHTYFKNE